MNSTINIEHIRKSGEKYDKQHNHSKRKCHTIAFMWRPILSQKTLCFANIHQRQSKFQCMEKPIIMPPHAASPHNGNKCGLND